MGKVLSELASDLDCSERSLRRYVNAGVLRGQRRGPHHLVLASGEEEYVRSHWSTLTALRVALRTERGVRLAVLFGSVATGDDMPESDVDLYVQMNGVDSELANLTLQARLSDKLDRPVHVVSVAPDEAANLVEAVIREGRVLIDRDGAWDDLRARERSVQRDAHTEAAAMMARAREVLAGAGG